MINNSKEIRKRLFFTDKDDFYFLQILKRRKDNPDQKKDVYVIGNYYIESLEQFDKALPNYINICNVENARAYIRLNKRNYKHLSYHMLKRVVEVVSTGAYKALKGSFDAVCGEYHNDKDKTWVVDIDWVDIISSENISGKYYSTEIWAKIMELQKETKKEPMCITLPTKNGIHLITRPFNLQEFKKKFPGIDVHKENPTILYCP
jgi:hypothetical protein